jgi:hypothetical protein
MKLELMKESRDEVMKQTTSISGARCSFMCAYLNSYSKSETARSPRTIVAAPLVRA